jgi:hypothetical protein
VHLPAVMPSRRDRVGIPCENHVRKVPSYIDVAATYVISALTLNIHAATTARDNLIQRRGQVRTASRRTTTDRLQAIANYPGGNAYLLHQPEVLQAQTGNEPRP